MITEDVVIATLKPIIGESMFDDGKVINFYDGGFVYVYTFTSLFQSAKDMSYGELNSVSEENNLGYEPYLLDWKGKGFI